MCDYDEDTAEHLDTAWRTLVVSTQAIATTSTA